MTSLTPQTLLLLLLQSSLSLAQTTATPTPQTTPPPSSSSTFSTTIIPASSSRRAGYLPASAMPNSDHGASGSDKNSYSLSTGGLIAVIVVVVGVAIFGIVSIVLFVLAKRRNWQLRESIKRASRRLTGRKPAPRSKTAAAKRKRSAGMLLSEQKAGTTVGYPPGQKRGLAVEIKDVEKGSTASNDVGGKGDGEGGKKANGEKKWVQRLWGNDWK